MTSAWVCTTLWWASTCCGKGLDLPEVSLVAILDADKEGYLRSGTSLIQTIGRAARHIEGRVVMYADRYTESMTFAISETNRRRELQTRHNEKHDITPYSIVKDIRDITERVRKTETVLADEGEPFGAEMGLPKDELTRIVKDSGTSDEEGGARVGVRDGGAVEGSDLGLCGSCWRILGMVRA